VKSSSSKVTNQEPPIAWRGLAFTITPQSTIARSEAPLVVVGLMYTPALVMKKTLHSGAERARKQGSSAERGGA
jgi:hypothetical protein